MVRLHQLKDFQPGTTEDLNNEISRSVLPLAAFHVRENRFYE
jgi:hypothetical protein